MVRLSEGQAAVVTVSWEGGLAVAPPRIDLEPGQRSTGLRIIDLESDAREWLLTIEGTAGHEYLVDLFGTAVQATPLGDGVSVSPAAVEDGDTPGAARATTWAAAGSWSRLRRARGGGQ